MKRIVFFIPLALLILSSCSTDKNEQLRNLKAQRDDLNARISQLEKELASSGELVKHENITYVNTKLVKPAEFNHYVEVQGTVESDDNVFVPAEMPGIVVKVLVKEGQAVKKGQLMAKLDGDLIQSQIDAIQPQLDLVTTVYERQKRLWEKEIGSEIQYLQAKTNKASLEKQIVALNKQLEMTEITSPIAGTVDKIMMKEGEMAAAGMSGIQVVGTGSLKIKANLSEAYFGEVKKGHKAKVEIPAVDLEFEQPIFAIAKVIDPGSRTFGVDIRPPHNVTLSPNMLAVITVKDYTNENALVVPQNLVQSDGQNKFLFVVEKKDNKTIARRKKVETGKDYKNNVEILSGLKAGDQLIVAGYQDASNGQQVTVK